MHSGTTQAHLDDSHAAGCRIGRRAEEPTRGCAFFIGEDAVEELGGGSHVGELSVAAAADGAVGERVLRDLHVHRG